MVNRNIVGVFTLAASLLTAASIVAAPAASQTRTDGSATADLAGVIADHWRWYLTDNPTFASTFGDRTKDGKLSDPSVAAADARAADAARFIARLDPITDAALSPTDRVNKAILRRTLDEIVTGNRYPQRLNGFTSYASWWQNFAGMADDLPFANAADYRSYLTRLAGYATYARASIGVGRQAVKAGVVLPCEALGGVGPSIAGLTTADPATSRYYAPFLKTRPIDMDAAAWSAMQAEAKRVILTVIVPQNRALERWYKTDYVPNCRKDPAAAALPQGRDWYAWRARVETTTDMTPDQIHALGVAEVTRIRAEMEAVATGAGYADANAMIRVMKTDARYFAKTPEELLAAASRQAKIIDGKMPTLFGKLPRLPYGVRAIPAETAEGTTTAYYAPGSPTSGIAGTYYVNTSKLAQRPLWELPALTAHESVPGHHHQIALQQELELPDFRRHAAFFTAFTEGWGLYAERLGVDMGIYDTPEKDMGRLSYEMWRACRLVVDTGIHAKGWTKARAVQFMRDNSALTDANIDAEVNRYISWPGQALGYKIGELKIRALREKAERTLGKRFDLRRFNDVVLEQGSVPLDVLEAQIDAWLTSAQGK